MTLPQPMMRISLRSSKRSSVKSLCVRQEAAPEEAPVPKTTKWRKRMNAENPDQYKLLQQEEALRAKHFRLTMTDEQRLHSNQLAAARMRKRRERLKLEAQQNPKKLKTKKNKVETRQEAEAKAEQREKWAVQKQGYRKKLTGQKKARLNKRRREKYAKDKKDNAMNTMQQPTPGPQSDNRTSAGKRKALQRAKSALPNNPISFANTVSDLIEKASPRKKLMLDGIGLLNPTESKIQKVAMGAIKTRLNSLRMKRKKQDLESKRVLLSTLAVLKRYGLLGKASKCFGITPKSFINVTKTKTVRRHGRALKETTVKVIHDFYEKSATTLPDKKLVSKKTGKEKMLLTQSIWAVHKNFLEQCSVDDRVVYSTFSKLRPRHVVTADKIKLRQCLCEYCQNASLKIAALNQVILSCNAPDKQESLLVKDHYHAVALTMCPRQGKYNNTACIYRNCKDCGVGKIREHLQPVVTAKGDQSVKFQKWMKPSLLITEEDQEATENNDDEDHEASGTIKSGGQHIHKSHFGIVTLSTTVQALVQELISDLGNLARHLFQAQWQSNQFNEIREAVPANSALMVLDFAQNYACDHQDQVQTAHWTLNQATVHPIVVYYPCEKCSNITTESLVFISNDLKHDHHAVHKFIETSVDHLRQERKCPLEQGILFSDGCSSQYKSKGPFGDTACAEEDFGIIMERSYFGTRHGKGPSDGESAVVKHHASTAVKTGEAIIDNPLQLYEYCSKALTRDVDSESETCSHFLRSFFFIESTDINREREPRHFAVKGTRVLHNVKSCGNPGMLLTRLLSCYCPACITGEGQCVNVEYVGKWKTVKKKGTATNASLTKKRKAGGSGPSNAVDENDAPQTTTSVIIEDPQASTSTVDGGSSSIDTQNAKNHEAAISSDPPISVQSIGQSSEKTATCKPSTSLEDKTSNNQTLVENESQYKVDDFVAAHLLKQRNTNIIYMAKVTDIDSDNGDVQLRYMKAEKPNKYEWPTPEDQGWQKAAEIVTRLDRPVLDEGRGFFFRFVDADMERVKALCPKPFKLC